jgi:hypothetical protein
MTTPLEWLEIGIKATADSMRWQMAARLLSAASPDIWRSVIGDAVNGPRGPEPRPRRPGRRADPRSGRTPRREARRMIVFRDRAFCSAYCATVDCERRWTAELQAAARQWWNPRGREGAGSAPVDFMNFGPICREYRRPWPHEDEDQRELRAGEVND